MLRELFHMLLGIHAEQLVWQDYAVAGVGSAVFLMLVRPVRGIFFWIKHVSRAARLSAWIACIASASVWSGLALDVFGYVMTPAVLLPIWVLVLIVVAAYVALTNE